MGSGAQVAPEEISVGAARDLLASLGFPTVNGLDLSRIFAATGEVESGGNPNVVTLERDAQTGEVLGRSWGFWQIFDGAHPELAATIQGIIKAGLPPADSMRAQASAIGSMFLSTVQEAFQAAQILEGRGYAVTTRELALLIDAVWQHGAGTVWRWAKGTATGAVEELHKRSERFLHFLEELGLSYAKGAGEVFAVEITVALIVLGILAWAWKKGWL